MNGLDRNCLVYLAAFASALALPSAAASQGSSVSSAVELARKADSLKPGQWVWAPQIEPNGPIAVYVDLSRQLATVYRNGVRIGVSTISSGKPGHETPTGVFVILQKDANHHSSKYNNAPMLFQERLTLDGVALHAGGLPGYPESHGCVHLPLQFAKLLFGATHMGSTVVVAGRAGSVLLTPAAGVLAPVTDKGSSASHVPLASNEPFRWRPELSPTGPLTVILSRSDQRAVVLRNGVEIGRSRIAMPTGDFETHAMTLTAKGGQRRWVLIGVPGHGAEAGRILDSGIAGQARFPAPFYESLQSAIVPGTTILITEAPVLPTTTGKSLTVLASKGRE